MVGETEQREADDAKVSKYGGAISKEIRRSRLWDDVMRHCRSGAYTKWNDDLDCIWSELCVDLKDDEFIIWEAKLLVCENKIISIGQIIDKMSESFENPTKEKIEKRKQHYKALREKEILLRRLENHLGKGTKWEDEEEDVF